MLRRRCWKQRRARAIVRGPAQHLLGWQALLIRRSTALAVVTAAAVAALAAVAMEGTRVAMRLPGELRARRQIRLPLSEVDAMVGIHRWQGPGNATSCRQVASAAHGLQQAVAARQRANGSWCQVAQCICAAAAELRDVVGAAVQSTQARAAQCLQACAAQLLQVAVAAELRQVVAAAELCEACVAQLLQVFVAAELSKACGAQLLQVPVAATLRQPWAAQLLQVAVAAELPQVAAAADRAEAGAAELHQVVVAAQLLQGAAAAEALLRAAKGRAAAAGHVASLLLGCRQRCGVHRGRPLHDGGDLSAGVRWVGGAAGSRRLAGHVPERGKRCRLLQGQRV